MRENISIEEALARVLDRVSMTTGEEIIGTADCCGRVLAEDVAATVNVPPFNRSAMDGYAVRAEEIHGACRQQPVSLEVVSELSAGDFEEISYREGTCVRVMTGAYVPDGYDAVVKQEDTDFGEDTVRIFKEVSSMENYSPMGEDIEKGDVILKKGTLLSPLHMGMAASVGTSYLKVKRPLRTVIISTGSELTEPGSPLEKGKIYGSIAYMLSGAIKSRGLEVAGILQCGDSGEEAVSLINRWIDKVDIVITTGAVSVGKKDFIPDALREMGAEKVFSGADIQPGTPTMASILKGKPILSLSGNPYAAMANFEIYFWDIAAKIMGCDDLKSKKAHATFLGSYGKINRRRRLIRAKEAEGRVWLPSDIHHSSVISNMTECNCFIDLEAGRKPVEGEEVRIIYIKGMQF